MGKRPKKHGLPTSKRFLTFTPLPGVEGGGGGVSLGPIVFPGSPCMPRARDKDSPCPHPPWPASSLPVAHARRRVGLRGFCGLPVFPLRGMCRASGRLSSSSSIASPPSPSGHTPPSCPAHMRGRDPGAGGLFRPVSCGSPCVWKAPWRSRRDSSPRLPECALRIEGALHAAGKLGKPLPCVRATRAG